MAGRGFAISRCRLVCLIVKPPSARLPLLLAKVKSSSNYDLESVGKDESALRVTVSQPSYA